MTRELRVKRQRLPLEKVYVFTAGRKQTLGPKEDLKRHIGTVQAKAYYTSKKKKRKAEWTRKSLI